LPSTGRIVNVENLNFQPVYRVANQLCFQNSENLTA
jgi:hypothetical protein